MLNAIGGGLDVLGNGREPFPNFSTRRFREWASASGCDVPSYMVRFHGADDGRAKIRMTNGISQQELKLVHPVQQFVQVC